MSTNVRAEPLLLKPPRRAGAVVLPFLVPRRGYLLVDDAIPDVEVLGAVLDTATNETEYLVVRPHGPAVIERVPARFLAFSEGYAIQRQALKVLKSRCDAERP